MKTRSLARIITAFSVTTLIAVMSFGSTTVFGVAAPTENPDNSRGVSPTFSGMNVTGSLNLGQDVTITHGSDMTGFYMSLGNKTLYTGSTMASSLFMVGSIAGRALLIDPDSMNPNGNFRVEVPAASTFTVGTGMGDNTMVVRNDSLTVNGASTITSGLTIGHGTADVRLEDLSVEGGATVEGGLNVLMHSIINSLAVGQDLTTGNFESRGLANFRGPITTSNLTVQNGSTFTVDGDLDLPFSAVAANVSYNTVGVKNTNAVCPAGKNLISCDLVFNSGFANVQAPGTLVFGNICQGRYNQSAANAVTGAVIATCL